MPDIHPKAATAHAIRVEEMRAALSALGPTTARDALVSCGAKVDWGEEMRAG